MLASPIMGSGGARTNTQTQWLTWERLKELVEFDGRGAKVLTVYLDLRPSVLGGRPPECVLQALAATTMSALVPATAWPLVRTGQRRTVTEDRRAARSRARYLFVHTTRVVAPGFFCLRTSTAASRISRV
jgi:hypothetical protein